MSEVCQIYHVARCGSTLLAALLSGTALTVCEPAWAIRLAYGDACTEHLSAHTNGIVKMQSILSCLDAKPAGAKIFLYRPLAQYLAKMQTCTNEWVWSRKQLYGQFLDLLSANGLEKKELTHISHLHSLFWSACVLKMQQSENVLWVRSNDLFCRPETISRECITHFGKTGSPALGFTAIDVKALKLNGQPQIKPLMDYNDKCSLSHDSTRGGIETSAVINNEFVQMGMDWTKLNLPINDAFLI